MVEQMPEYNGGDKAMAKFISKNIRYPVVAQRMKITGTVFVSFIINEDGSISEVSILKGISKECDEEAKRVVEMMPMWIPGKQDDKYVKVRFVCPIKFKLGA
jgi:periplasmic protein TonB